jgi:hypothetical protein
MRRLWFILLLLLAAVIALLFSMRRETQAAFGPAVALCPGPDRYGYTCENGAAFAYIDATNDTGLYEDDGATTLALPFPFTFYGTTYNQVQATSNGTLHFGQTSLQYNNVCLSEGPAGGLGDMIAPFWDDLDLRAHGFLEHETVGSAPERVFVIEWDDVPRFDSDEDRATFAVQLFEGSNGIVFLYQDVAMFEGHNGSSATIGIQSESQGLVLQFGCNQPVVADASALHLRHPAEANEVVGQQAMPAGLVEAATPAAKGEIARVVDALNQQGATALNRLQVQWLNQRPPRASQWQWLDLTGDGREELLLLWHSTPQHAQLTQLIVLAADESDELALLRHHHFSTRQEVIDRLDIVATADLTGDGHVDPLLHAPATGQLFVVTASSGLEVQSIPERCQGSMGVLDVDGDGRFEVVRDGCETQGRVIYAWNGREFASASD